ncbi:cytochrome b562 [Escherichia coli]|uniref:cytochrome b562 n=1 Tax=Escherichia coli TaxID=562 RepID=UPI000B80295E|nr:cytochrome b562 [Escherichia coli]
MKKQKKFILISMLALFLSASQISMAAELDKNMQTLAKNMSILKSSSDKTSLLNALAMMDKAVDDSMEVLPWNIDSDDKVAVKNYKNDLKKLKDEINVAKEKIESGNIESLRDSLEKMNNIKLDSHRKFR